jgi:hypothetical protein
VKNSRTSKSRSSFGEANLCTARGTEIDQEYVSNIEFDFSIQQLIPKYSSSPQAELLGGRHGSFPQPTISYAKHHPLIHADSRFHCWIHLADIPGEFKVYKLVVLIVKERCGTIQPNSVACFVKYLPVRVDEKRWKEGTVKDFV